MTRFEHIGRRDLARYLDGQISADELLAFDNHIAGCDACYTHIAESKDVERMLSDAALAIQEITEAEPLHLTYEQMAAFVDNDLSDVDREIVESHQQVCPNCKSDLDDLMAITTRLALLPASVKHQTEKQSLRDRVAAMWNVTSFRIPVEAAVATLTLGLIMWVAISVFRSSGEGNTPAGSSPEASSAPAPPEKPDQSPNRFVAVLRDGDARIAIDDRSNLSGLESLPLSVQEQVRVALKDERVKTPSFIETLRGKAGQTMGAGGDEDYGLISPVAVVLETRKPTFRWRPANGASSYTVTVYDENSKKVAASGPITRPNWTLNRPLARGKVYTWQVRATKGDKEIVLPPPAAPDAKFFIVDRAAEAKLQRARSGPTKSHLVLGVLYAEAGMLEDSVRELRKLVVANPESSVAKNLLRSVEAQKRSR